MSKRITDLPAATSLSTSDVVPVVHISGNETDKATITTLAAAVDSVSTTRTIGGPVVLSSTGGATGSMTKLVSGAPFITAPAGNIVTVTTGSGGQIVISGSAPSTTPGGTSGQLQYDNGGAFGGVTGTSYTGGALTLALPVTASMGLSASFVQVGTANVATTGLVRLTNLGGIYSRNAAGTNNLRVAIVDGSDEVLIGDSTTLGQFNASSLTLYSATGNTYIYGAGNQVARLGASPGDALALGTTLVAGTAQFNIPVTASLGVSASFVQVGTGTTATAGSIRGDSSFSIVHSLNGVDRPVIQGDNSAQVIVGGFAANECSNVILRTYTGGIYNQINGSNYLTVTTSKVLVDQGVLAIGATPSTTGAVRVANNTTINARNQANSGDVQLIGTDTNDYIYIGSDSTLTTNRAGYIYVVPTAGVFLGSNGTVALKASSADGVTLQNSLPFVTTISNPASAGTIRMGNAQIVSARNAGNSADIQVIGTDSSNNINIGSDSTLLLNRASGVNIYPTTSVALGVSNTTYFYCTAAGAFIWNPPLTFGSSGGATTGTIRFRNADNIVGRNSANSLDFNIVGFDSSNRTKLGDDTNGYCVFYMSQAGSDAWLKVWNGSSYAMQWEAIGTNVSFGVPVTGLSVPYGSVNGIATQAMSDANQTPASSVYQNAAMIFSGSLTARRTATIPTATDSQAYLKVVDNLCSGSGSIGIIDGASNHQTADFGGGTTGIVLVDSRGVMKIANGADPARFDFRLSLSSSVPITTTDAPSATTLYLNPFTGGRLSLFSGSHWQSYDTDVVSASLGTLTSGSNYDVFAYWNGSAVAMEFLAWTNNTTRATSLSRQTGVLVKSSDPTRRYVGTFRTTTTTTTEDSQSKRFVWNNYNRTRRTLKATDSTASWTFTSTATWRLARAAATNQFEYVVGDVTEWEAGVYGMSSAATANGGSAVGIGINSTTVNSAQTWGGSTLTSNDFIVTQAGYRGYATLGYSLISWLEICNFNPTTFYGAGTYQQTGMLGSIFG